MALTHAHSVSLPPLPPQHSLPQLPPQHYLTPQLSMSHSLAPQHSMPLLPQHSTPLLQTVESRLAGPETSLDIGSLQLPAASNLSASGNACKACQAGSLGSKHCSSAASLGSSAAAASSASIGTCRICFEQDGIDKPEDAANPLITPCQCTGSSKYVHRLCLKQWREKKHRSDAFFQCEVCQYRYRYRRLWWSHLLGHQNTLTALFMVTLVACIALLGFVPITNTFFLVPTSSSSSSSSSSGSGIGSSSGSGIIGGFGGAGIGLGSSSVDVDPFGGSYIGSSSGSSSIGGGGIGSSQAAMRQHAAMHAALPHPQHTRPGLASGTPTAAAAAAAAAARHASTLPASPISYFVVHTFNGLILMALLGLMLSLMMKVGRAFGLPALALLPDPWSSTGACLWCMDLHGGLSPFVTCSSGAGECGLAVLVIMSVLMLMLGLVLAAYLLYGVLWVLVQAGLSKAQQLVENVQLDGKGGKEAKAAKAAKA
uniref:RING-CH-type domain-containing protein n=1 Tax=Tetradesmus obliquus TaxID=3088 RepID=A0A383VTN4_TETOB|eukprot:jgi/Sobl393_1/17129/SZX68270.1